MLTSSVRTPVLQRTVTNASVLRRRCLNTIWLIRLDLYGVAAALIKGIPVLRIGLNEIYPTAIVLRHVFG